MPKPKNSEWIVTGRVVLVGAYVKVHATSRAEAIAKATSGDYIGEVETEQASVSDFSGSRAEVNVGDE